MSQQSNTRLGSRVLRCDRLEERCTPTVTLEVNPTSITINEGETATLDVSVSGLAEAAELSITWPNGDVELESLTPVDGLASHSTSRNYPDDSPVPDNAEIVVSLEEDLVQNNSDVVFVLDVSLSTTAFFKSSSEPVGDVNQDGLSDRVLDGEIAALLEVEKQLIDQGATGTRLSVVTFSTGAAPLDLNPAEPGVQLTTTPGADADGNGISDLTDALRTVRSNGGTSYNAALSEAVNVFNSINSPNGQGNLIFISDGSPARGGNYQAPLDDLEALGVRRRAYGVGDQVDLTHLQNIDESATRFFDPADLVNAVSSAFSGGGNATVRVPLTVLNLPPSAGNDAFVVNADAMISNGNLLDNDSDPVGALDPLTVTAMDTTGTLGSVTDNGDGTFRYTPPAEFADLLAGTSETDSFSYTIDDGDGGQDTATVTITVLGQANPDPDPGLDPNDDGLNIDNPPVVGPALDAVDDTVAVLHCNSGAGNLLANDEGTSAGTLVTEINGDNSVIGQAQELSQGTLTVNVDGSMSFVPAEGFAGSFTFTYTIVDGAESDTATVTVSSDAIPSGPSITMMGDVLLIVGTPNLDQIELNEVVDDPTGVTVRSNINGWQPLTFTGVRAIEVLPLEGDDNVLMMPSMIIPVCVDDAAGNGLFELGHGNNTIITHSTGFYNIVTGDGDDYIELAGGGSQIKSGGGHDHITTGMMGFDNVEAGAGNDTIHVGHGGSQVKSGEGHDHVVAWNGFDNVELGDGHDFADIGSEGGIIKGDTGNDTMLGGDGIDRLEGGDGSDMIMGLAGNDFLDGQGDADLLMGGMGWDQLEGGEGDDLLLGDNVTAKNDSDDLITLLGVAMQTMDFSTVNLTPDNNGDMSSGEEGDDTFWYSRYDRLRGTRTETRIYLS